MMFNLGPMARSVEDCISILESWFSPDHLPFFPQITSTQLTSELIDQLENKKLKIAYYTDTGFIKACPAVERVVKEAKEIL